VLRRDFDGLVFFDRVSPVVSYRRVWSFRPRCRFDHYIEEGFLDRDGAPRTWL